MFRYLARTDGAVRGIISLADVQELTSEEQNRQTVGEVMEPISPETVVAPNTPVAEALRKMTEQNVGRLIAMRDNQLVGMITQTGVLRSLKIHRALANAVSDLR